MKDKSFKYLIGEIVRDVKAKHFPHLPRTFILFKKRQDYYMSIRVLPFGFSLLEVDCYCMKFDRTILEALVCHEFGHFDFWDSEREADLTVIRCGYGEGLRKFHKQHNKEFKSYKKHEGLTLKEIEKIIKV